MSGMEQNEIAQKYGLTQGRISQILAEDDSVKYLISTATRAQARMLGKVIRNYDKFLDDTDDKQIQLKASQDVMRNVGITPSHTQSITINNIMQTNNIMADPEIMAALKQALQPGGDIIELEP